MIHTADRESYSYEIISKLSQEGWGFVLRLKFNRNILTDNEAAKLYDILEQAQGVIE